MLENIFLKAVYYYYKYLFIYKLTMPNFYFNFTHLRRYNLTHSVTGRVTEQNYNYIF